MNYNVTDIEFDFDDDEDDLIEEITCNAGWCVESIDYEIQLK